MINICDKSQCTGCTACYQICNHQAIKMCYDEDGHFYPHVDESKCVDCGLCNLVCPMLHRERIPKDEDLNTLQVYAAYNKDNEIRENSTSGGVFSLISQLIIEEGGIVYAAKFDDNFHIKHSSFSKMEEINPYRGSKYAQSDLGDTFKNIRKDLKNRKVLFIGTPCQVTGLKSYLQKDYENLFTCDFICMGISSPRMWEEYLLDYWKGKEIERIFFKDKRDGWHQWKMFVKYKNGEYLKRGMEDPFFYSYLTHLSYRPSCFKCPFRTCRRISDITIADCWGIDKADPSFDDNKGCTTLILQSQKAESFFSQIKNKMEYKPYNIMYVQKYNPYIVKPIQSHLDSQTFYEYYHKNGFMAAVQYCMISSHVSIVTKIFKKLKSLL